MACAEVANYLNIPSHVFMGCSDAKRPDSQSGLESGIGLVLGALTGANIVQSAGGLSDVTTTSLEKLVIDNEICGMAYRLIGGIALRGERLAEDLFNENLYDGDHFLLSPNTLKWFKAEASYPGKVLSREDVESWKETGGATAELRAKEAVKRILSTHESEPLDPEIDKELLRIMTRYARKHGMDKLPFSSLP
jgi:trimethylamine--corrinoid protein Co-methyltransferase